MSTRGETRTPKVIQPTDFKSVASTIPPHEQKTHHIQKGKNRQLQKCHNGTLKLAGCDAQIDCYYLE